MVNKSNLDLVNECDEFPYPDSAEYATLGPQRYYKFKLEGCQAVLGLIPTEVILRFPLTEIWIRREKTMEFIFNPSVAHSNSETQVDERTRILAQYLQSIREAKVFQVLNGWRDEVYPIYGPGKELLFSMERSASALFGIVTYGVHMTAYVNTAQGMKIWAPKRSATKQTYPGMMDNTVAGGLSTGEEPFGCLIRESMEEASLPESVAKRSQACGTMTYFHIRDSSAGGETGLCQPECQYVYDLVLPNDVIPKPCDNEAVDFQLLSVQEVQSAMAAGRFKPNCALLLLEFFVRHGIVTAESEPNYVEIVSRLHRRLEFPMR